MTRKRKLRRRNVSVLLVTLTFLTNVIPSMTVSAAWEKKGGVIGRLPQEESQIVTSAKVTEGTFEEIPDEAQKEEGTQEELYTKEENLENLSVEEFEVEETTIGDGDLDGNVISMEEDLTQEEVQYAYLVVRTLHGLEELSGGSYRLYSKTSVTDESGQTHTPDTWIEQSESSDGICMFTTRLPIGTYYVEEVEPPPGYYQAESHMELVITSDTFEKEDPSEPSFAFVTLSYYEASQMRSAAIWQPEETTQVEETEQAIELDRTKEDPETEGVSETEEEKLEGTMDTNPKEANDTMREATKEDPEMEGVSETEEEKLEGTTDTNPKDANETNQEDAKEAHEAKEEDIQEFLVYEVENQMAPNTQEVENSREIVVEESTVGFGEDRTIDVRAPDEYSGGARASPAFEEWQDTIENVKENINIEVSLRYE